MTAKNQKACQPLQGGYNRKNQNSRYICQIIAYVDCSFVGASL
jgi:hypothetical protein